MTSKNETGHAKNVANFEKLIEMCVGFGEKYNPANNAIAVAALQTKVSEARAALDAVNAVLPAYSNAVASREEAFSSLNHITSGILNFLKATDTPEKIVSNVSALVRRVQGRRTGSKPVAAQAVVAENENGSAETQDNGSRSISTSHMSFDFRLENFDKLIKLISNISQYAPKEEELKPENLISKLNALKTSNNNVMNAVIPVNSARIKRNEVLYNAKTGLSELAAMTKSYVKALFGVKSPQFKQLSRLVFSRK